LFEGLVIPDPTDSTKQLPGVADSWEHNEESSIWTFHLRTNARWSNGDPVTATDFAFSLQRIFRPELGALFADYLYIIRGAEDFHKGRIKDFNQVGVRVIDSQTWQSIARALFRTCFEAASFLQPGLLRQDFLITRRSTSRATIQKKHEIYWQKRVTPKEPVFAKSIC
jgi:Bacterial extracellular solute-binding proteins, family 5 Middle